MTTALCHICVPPQPVELDELVEHWRFVHDFEVPVDIFRGAEVIVLDDDGEEE